MLNYEYVFFIALTSQILDQHLQLYNLYTSPINCK